MFQKNTPLDPQRINPFSPKTIVCALLQMASYFFPFPRPLSRADIGPGKFIVKDGCSIAISEIWEPLTKTGKIFFMEKNESMMSKRIPMFFYWRCLSFFPVKRWIFPQAYVATVNGEKIYLEEYRYRLNQKMAMLPKDVAANETGI